MTELDASDKILAAKMDKEIMFDLLDNLKAAAKEVSRHMKLSPGEDSYEYTGSTSDIDWLKEAASAWEDYQMELSDGDDLDGELEDEEPE